MRKPAPPIEWQIVESDADWERRHAASGPDVTPDAEGNQRPKRTLAVVGALLVLLVAGSLEWRIDQGRADQAAEKITEMAQPAPGAVAPDQVSLVASLPGDQAAWAGDQYATDWQRHFAPDDGNLRATIQADILTEETDAHVDITLYTVEFRGELAVAHFRTAGERGVAAHRQTRFYRRIGPDWRQTEPDAALWGPERSLETPSLLYYFCQNDAQAVIAVTPQIEELYTTLRRNFGLPSTQLVEQPFARIGEKLVIEVSLTQSPGRTLFEPHDYEHFVMQDRLIVASPALYRAPVDMTDAELLAQAIALPLLAQVSAQASERYQIGSTWQPLLDGLRLWQVWDTDLPLALWREEIVRWVHHDRPGAGSAQTVVLPQHYETLCTAHTLWMEAPTMVGIPLLCYGLDWEAWHIGTWGRRYPRARLDQLALPTPNSYPYETHVWGQTVALTTLIEYAVDTYGRERLPALVAGLGQHDSWETLLPAVYGVSAREFEQGWQAYLATHYDVSLDTIVK